jgi:hypothetical protein
MPSRGKKDMAAASQSPLGSIALAGDDRVVPYQVAPLDIRGRSVQLGPMLNAILARHDYPRQVAALLGEAIVLTVLLGTSLKFEGKFIVQTQMRSAPMPGSMPTRSPRRCGRAMPGRPISLAAAFLP